MHQHRHTVVPAGAVLSSYAQNVSFRHTMFNVGRRGEGRAPASDLQSQRLQKLVHPSCRQKKTPAAQSNEETRVKPPQKTPHTHICKKKPIKPPMRMHEHRPHT